MVRTLKVPAKFALTLFMSFAVWAAHAEFPDKPVRLIVPFAAGGTTDGIGRLLASQLGPTLGGTVVVDNRPGASGIIGSELGARAAPDGYTVVLASLETLGITEIDRKRLRYDPEKDIIALAGVGRAPVVLCLSPNVPATDMKTLIEYARAHPGQLRYGTPGVATNPHIVGESFARAAGIKIEAIAYKGGSAGMVDVLSGNIEMLFTGVNTAAASIGAGQIKAVAITATKRSPKLPNVPTMDELGLKNVPLGPYFGIYGPAQMPEAVVNKLSAAIATVTQSAAFRARLVEMGYEELPALTGKAFGQYFSGEAARWRAFAESVNVRPQ